MYYWICLRADNTAGLFKTDSRSKIVSYTDFQYIKSECEMAYAETVPITYGSIRYQMLVDEEGKINDKPLNVVATALFNDFDYIVGDVAILGMPIGSDMYYMDRDEAESLFEYIKNEINLMK